MIRPNVERIQLDMDNNPGFVTHEDIQSLINWIEVLEPCKPAQHQ